jgi:hypothetical protein
MVRAEALEDNLVALLATAKWEDTQDSHQNQVIFLLKQRYDLLFLRLDVFHLFCKIVPNVDESVLLCTADFNVSETEIV